MVAQPTLGAARTAAEEGLPAARPRPLRGPVQREPLRLRRGAGEAGVLGGSGGRGASEAGRGFGGC